MQKSTRAITYDNGNCPATERTRACNTHSCVPDTCLVSAWTPWTDCTDCCGGGTQSRTRSVTLAGPNCPSLQEVRPCNMHSCTPAACQMGPWGPWDDCSDCCGGGTQKRTRAIVLDNGSCPSTEQTRVCNLHSCVPPTCAYSDWSSWGTCSDCCGGGVQTRTRTLVRDNGNCMDPLSEDRACNMHSCIPPTCVVSDWTDWSDCSACCGTGDQSRTRTITSPGANCPATTQNRKCNMHSCTPSTPPPCVMGPWGMFDDCTACCGGGTMSRTRVIDTQPVGATCPATEESRPCNMDACIPCAVGAWSPWTPCDQSTLKQTRERAVVTMGQNCPELQEERSCQFVCTYSDWHDWAPCDKCCDGGTQTRYRTSYNPACSNEVESRPCNTQDCPQFCVDPPADPNHGHFDHSGCRNTPVGDTCTLTCDTGYTQTGDSLCNPKDTSTTPVTPPTWTPQTCTPNDCTSKPSYTVANGTWNCASTTHGGTCELNCLAGYVKTGDAECNLGVYSTEDCHRVTVDDCTTRPTNPANGHYGQCVNIWHGHLCPLTCDDGYTKQGDAVCNKTQYILPGNPPCKENPCPSIPSAIPNGQWNCVAPVAGQAGCALQCDTGYDATNTKKCEKGLWTGDATCTPTPCVTGPTYTPAHSSGFTTACTNVPSGSSCTPNCDTGYAANDAECQHGTWTHEDCHRITDWDCLTKPTNPANGHYASCTDVAPGDKCLLTCDAGFTKSDDALCVNKTYLLPANPCVEDPCTAPPPHNTHSTYTCAGTTVAAGQTCTLTCKPGYRVGDDADALCSKGGWVDVDNCVPQECHSAPAPQPANGQYADCKDVAHGGSCPLICDSGYVPSGDPICEYGTWYLTECRRETTGDCKDAPADPANGHFAACANTWNGNVCALSCDDGYTKTGDAQCKDAAWQTPAPTCEPNPCQTLPPAPTSGSFTCTLPVAHNNYCPMTCSTGHTGTNDNQAQCIRGQWVAVDECPPDGCPAAPTYTITNGQVVSCGATNHLGKCTVECMTGYNKTGDAVCTYGTWSQPLCQRITVDDCTLPPSDPANGHYDSCVNVWTGDKCTLTCNDGYYKTGDAICDKSAYTLPLSGPGPCIEKPCPDKPVATSVEHWTCTPPVSGGGHCTLTCDTGYSVTQNGNADCVKGTWHDQDSCVPDGCPVGPTYTVAGGAVADCRDTAHNGECTLTCTETDYQKTGNPKCVLGQWTVEECHRITVNDCVTPPTPTPNGAFDSCTNVWTGETCALHCDAGYTKTSDALCVNTVYTNSPTCTPNPCEKQPDQVSNGQWQCGSHTDSGNYCVLACDTGYTATGDGKAQCDKSVWKDSETCEPNPCTSAPTYTVANGQFSGTCTNTPSGGTCTVTCDTDYKKSGDAYCNKGQWTVEDCHRDTTNDCTAPPQNPPYGLYTCSNVQNGDTCGLFCETGYEKVAEAVCRQAVWDTVANPCVPKDCTSLPPATNNGQWGCVSPVSSGQTCALQCDSGYIAKDDGSALCTTGNWRDEDACTPAPCTDGPTFSVSNGQFAGSCFGSGSVEHGTLCPLTCTDPYLPSGDSICRHGEWTVVGCHRNTTVDCTTAPTNPANGQYASCLNIWDTAPCVLTCNAGYVKTGDATCNKGTYDLPDATNSGPCRPAACAVPPADPTAGTYACVNGQDHGEKCNLICDAGYMATGDAKIECQTGQWISPETCEPSPCADKPADPTMGSYLQCLNTPHDGTCTLVCDQGYVKSGDAKCQYGTWSPQTCEVDTSDDCVGPPPGTMLNGQYGTCAHVKNGESCELTCDSGYTKTSDALCTSTVYTTIPTCQPDPCPARPSNPNNGMYDAATCPTPVTHGTTCELTCNTGFVVSADGLADCEHGDWTNTDVCEPSPCTDAPPADVNGRWVCQSPMPYLHQELCQLDCDVGYEAGTTGTIQCLNGAWVNPDSCGPAKCPTPPANPDDGTFANCIDTPHGNSCELSCNTGFTKSADAICDKGTWTQSARCVPDAPTNCKTAPTDPANGFGSYAACVNVPIGDACELTCDAGYEKTGDAICSASGTYVLPTGDGCEEMPCTTLPSAPINGAFGCGLSLPVAAGEYCALTCDSGYVPSDDGQVKCSKGAWIEPETCDPLPCSTSPSYAINNGHFTGQCAPIPHEGSCELVCNTGYAKSGDAKCDKGVWTVANCHEIKDDDCKVKPANPPNGQYNDCADVASGSVCDLVCDTGFTKVGDAVCDKGTYILPQGSSGQPCEPTPCTDLPPAVSQGTWDCPAIPTANGGHCELLCATGYQVSSTLHATCSHGSWVDLTSCEPKPCDSIVPYERPGATWASNCRGTAHGGTCVLTCPSPKVKSGDAVCQFGTWSVETCDTPATGDCTGAPTTTVTYGDWGPCGTVAHTAGCELICDQGYEKTGDAVCDNGNYNLPPAPYCKEKECVGYPPDVASGDWACMTQEECTLTCNSKYDPSDDGKSICVKGTWSSVDTCIPKGCTAPTFTPENGGWTTGCNTAAHGDECLVTCQAGFETGGNSICEYGVWSTVKCVPSAPSNCHGKPDDPPHGSFAACSNIAHGDECELTCDSGYSKIGDALCQDGTLILQADAADLCQEDPCTEFPPDVANGAYSCQPPFPAGKECAVTCDTGYSVSDDGKTVCHLGHWTDKDTCVPAPCTTEPAKPANGDFAQNCANTDLCILTCEQGYTASADSTCSLGVWSTVSCIPLPPQACVGTPVATVANGAFALCGSVPSGSACELNCDSGFLKTGDATCVTSATSVSTYQLPPAPYCNPLPCQDTPPDVPQGTWGCVGPANSGEECALTCDTGYEASGDGVAKCYAGQWQEADTCVVKSCETGPTYTLAGSFAPCQHKPHGSFCALTCATGFTKSGDAECIRGTWTTETCTVPTPQSCTTRPTDPAHGHYKTCSVVAHGDECELECDTGYTRSGNAVCTDGAYSLPSGPECIPTPCTEYPPTPNFGSWACNGPFPDGKECASTCETGYETLGDGKAVCTLGQWYSVDNCVPKGCPAGPLYTPTQGSFSTNCAGAIDGQTCLLTCNSGFGKSADALCEKGSWTVQNCHPVQTTDCAGVPSPAPANGHFAACSDVPLGGECELLCDAGFTATGNAVCGASSTYDLSAAACTETACPAEPHAPNVMGSWNCPFGLNHGSECTLICPTGYEAADDGKATCYRGHWSGEEQCDPAKCRAEPVENSGKGYYLCSNALPATNGQFCPLVCDNSWEADGDGHAVCTDGAWTSVDQCTAVPCPQPPNNPAHGTYACPALTAAHPDYISGDECELTCEAGYTYLSGANSTCHHGVWENTDFCIVSPCYPDPCDHGACRPTSATAYTCDCQTGWTGHTCSEMISCALAQPCVHGDCHEDGNGNVWCTCDQGWEGLNCDAPDLPDACGDQCVFGFCVDSTASCSCLIGYGGTYCDQPAIPGTDPCDGYDCSGHGTCMKMSVSNDPFCRCDVGWSSASTNCSTEDPCSANLNPCQNSGTCETRYGVAYCTCPEPYSGVNCEIDDNAVCANDICNGGTCTPKYGKAQCTDCPQTPVIHYGTYCNETVDVSPPPSVCNSSMLFPCLGGAPESDPADAEATCNNYKFYAGCAIDWGCPDFLAVWCTNYFVQEPTCTVPACNSTGATCDMAVYQQCWNDLSNQVFNTSCQLKAEQILCAKYSDCWDLVQDLCTTTVQNDCGQDTVAPCNTIRASGNWEADFRELVEMSMSGRMHRRSSSSSSTAGRSSALVASAAAAFALVAVVAAVAIRRRRQSAASADDMEEGLLDSMA